jgi:hypothetical protein
MPANPDPDVLAGEVKRLTYRPSRGVMKEVVRTEESCYNMRAWEFVRCDATLSAEADPDG